MTDLPELFVQKDPLYQLALCVAYFKKLLSGFKWNNCPDSSGITVQNQMESVSRITWNRCPESRGIGVRFALEFAPQTIQWQIVDKETVDEIIFRTMNTRNRLMLELMARGGMRVGEVLNFKPVDIQERTLSIQKPKS